MSNEKSLFQACLSNDVAGALHLLSKSRPDFNWENPDFGQTVFHVACRENRQEILEELLRQPIIDVNKPSRTKATGLHLACVNGAGDSVRLLLRDPRVEVNHTDQYDRTPLWEAVNHERVHVVKWLLASGRALELERYGKVEAEIQGNGHVYSSGQMVTAMELARQRHQQEMVRMLEGFKANPLAFRIAVRRELGLQTNQLEQQLGVPLPFCGWLLPEGTTDPSKATSLSLPNLGLALLSEQWLCFMKLTELDLSNNPLEPSSGAILGKLIQSNPKLRVLKISGTKLGPEGLLHVLKTLAGNFSQKILALETVVVDDIMLTSFEGLGIIPIDILQQGTKMISQFLLDLYKSPDAVPLYKTKLMVVGYEGVGKTTLLDCLFPISNFMDSKGTMVKTKYLFKLQGRYLLKLKDAQTPHKLVAVFNNRSHTVVTEGKVIKIAARNKPNLGDTDGLESRPDLLAKNEGSEESLIYFPTHEECLLWLNHLSQADSAWKTRQVSELALSVTPRTVRAFDSAEIHCPDEQTHALWTARLKRACMNEATHGIDIQNICPDHPITRDYFKNKTGSLNISVWDFAGQQDYYHSHHYFLTSRTVFLVLWRLSERQSGLEGLEFWLRSLAAHLGHQTSTEIYHSVTVVGTYLENPAVFKILKDEREQEVKDLAAACGLKVNLQYFEVSCATLENIESLQASILKTALTHSYMGERIPKGYQAILDYIVRARREKELPILDFNDLGPEFGGAEFTKRALKLLSLWGDCVYFDDPPSLAKTVILDPKFLTKDVLGQFFKPTNVPMFKGGIIRHSDFAHMFKSKNLEDPLPMSKTLFALMQRFEVCFLMEGDRDKKFADQRSIVPALLPEKNSKETPKTLAELKDDLSTDMRKFGYVWPQDPPYERPYQMERALLFNVIPVELVSRLLVRLHSLILRDLVWRDEVVILDHTTNTQGWIRVSALENSFCITLRGAGREGCLKLLNTIVNEVTAACRGCGGVSWREAYRSPLSTFALILQEELLAEIAKPLEQRTLVCPETHFPLLAERLLVNGGQANNEIPREGGWWDTIFNGLTTPLAIPVIGAGAQGDSPFLQRLSLFLSKMNGNVNDVSEAFAVNNPISRVTLSTAHFSLEGKLTDTKSLFRKQEWKKAKNHLSRRKVLHHLGDYARKFRSVEWNNGALLPVIPMIQKIPEKLAWLVAKYGFGVMPATETGLYGQGVYFSTSAEYVSQSVGNVNENDYVYLISLVLPGSSYPVIDNPYEQDSKPLSGRPIISGYQSHYVVVSTAPENFGLPPKELDLTSPLLAGELLLTDPSQVMPLFIFKKKPGKASSGGVTTARREWRMPIDSTWNDSKGVRDSDLSKAITATLQEIIAEAGRQNAPGLLERYQTFSNLTRQFMSEATQTQLGPEFQRELATHITTFSQELKVVQDGVKAIKKAIEQGNLSGEIQPLLKIPAELDKCMRTMLGILSPSIIASPFSSPRAHKWWRTDIRSAEETLVSVYSRGVIHNQGLVDKLVKLFPALGQNLNLLNHVYWIHNPRLATLFEATVESIAIRQQINPNLFLKDDWKLAPDAVQKKVFLDYLEKLKAPLYDDWNGHQPVSIITMMQGTSENGAHRIAKNGFGTVASLDAGWYGQGIYLTSQVSYANMFATKTPEGRVFIVSLVAPGNIYPVTEPPFKDEGVIVNGSEVNVKVPNPAGFLGKSCRPGYQSHFSVVERTTKGFGQPIKGTMQFSQNDELVIFEPSQALPLFLVYSDKLISDSSNTKSNYEYSAITIDKNNAFFG